MPSRTARHQQSNGIAIINGLEELNGNCFDLCFFSAFVDSVSTLTHPSKILGILTFLPHKSSSPEYVTISCLEDRTHSHAQCPIQDLACLCGDKGWTDSMKTCTTEICPVRTPCAW
jgi:hypothetical protein